MSDSPENEVREEERAAADVAMNLLKMSSNVDFAVAVYETKEDDGEEEAGFVVEWAGQMNRYMVLGILQRAIHLLGTADSEEEEEEDE